MKETPRKAIQNGTEKIKIKRRLKVFKMKFGENKVKLEVLLVFLEGLLFAE